MFKYELQQLGLTEREAYVYSILLEKKEITKASEILKILENDNLEKAKLNKKRKAKEREEIIEMPRVLMYKVLEDLIDKKIVEKIQKNKTHVLFKALSPQPLIEAYKKQIESMQLKEKKLSKVINKLEEDYHKNSVLPGIILINDEKDYERITNMMLESKTDIYTYSDPIFDIDDKEAFKRSKKNVEKRKELGINKKVIFINIKDKEKEIEKFAKNYSNKVTEVKLMEENKAFKNTVTHIFDGKVVYFNKAYKNKKWRLSAIVIIDQKIYDIQKYLFEKMWESL